MPSKSTSKPEAPEAIAKEPTGEGLGVKSVEEKKAIFAEAEEQAKGSPDKGTGEGEAEGGDDEEKGKAAPAAKEEPEKSEAPEAGEQAGDEEKDPIVYLQKAKGIDPKDPEALQKLAKMYVGSEKLARESAKERAEMKKVVEELKPLLEKEKGERTKGEEAKKQEMMTSLKDKFWTAFEDNPLEALTSVFYLLHSEVDKPRKEKEAVDDVDRQIMDVDEHYGKKLEAKGQGKVWKAIRLKTAQFIHDNPEVMEKKDGLKVALHQVLGGMMATGEMGDMFKAEVGDEPKPAFTETAKGGGSQPKLIDKGGAKSPEDQLVDAIFGVGAKRKALHL